MARAANLVRTIALALCAGSAGAPARAADWSAEIALVSDYRYRGVTLSNGRPAVQGALSVEHGSGAYGEIWASSLDPDGPSRSEVDVTAGYAADLTDTVSVDVSATYYAYPGAPSANALEITGLVEAGRGPLSANGGLSIVPPQAGSRDEAGTKRTNLYAFAGASYELGVLPVTLRAGIGYERGPWDLVERGGKWDWSLRGEAALAPARIGLEVAGSDAGDEGVVATFVVGF